MGQGQQAQPVEGRADARRAAEILRAGGVVAFPTETVYGLGADATNAAAVRQVFEIKGRPATNPLIVHVADAAAARRCVAEWPEAAQKLAERFWPGPLTIVLPKAETIVPEVSAGGATVGVRVPDHPLALEMLRAFAEIRAPAQRRSAGAAPGIAAPSANRSNHVSPTTAQHVRDDLGDAVDLILDGGRCGVGIESTVLSLATPVPTVLRPGGVSVAQLREVLGEVELRGGSDRGIAASPGRQERHYAPRVPLRAFMPAERARLEIELRDTPSVLLCLGPGRDPMASADDQHDWPLVVGMPGTPKDYARWLYAQLRLSEALGAERIFIELPPDEPAWAAVRDRIRRATRA